MNWTNSSRLRFHLVGLPLLQVEQVLAREIVRTLVGCNANTVILSRNQDLAQKLITEIPKNAKARILPVHGDVLQADVLQKANQIIQSEFGNVDILI